MGEIILTKESSQEEIKRYFEGVLQLEQTGEKFPVTLDNVLQIAYSQKRDAIRHLQSEQFIEGIDFVACQSGKVVSINNLQNGVKANIKISVPCLEFLVARKVRKVFEIYRQVFHRVVKLSPWQIVTNALSVAQNQLAIYKDQLDQARAESADTYKLYKAQKEENTKLLPDANYTRETLTSKSTWNTNVVAKEFGLTAKTLNKKLKDLGIQYKQHGVWLLSSEYQNKSYTKTRTYPYINSKGEVCSRLQTEWTEAGRKWLHELHDKKKF